MKTGDYRIGQLFFGKTTSLDKKMIGKTENDRHFVL